jgi:hypothetical protein
MTLIEAWETVQQTQAEYDDAHEWEMQKSAEVNALREQIAALQVLFDPAIQEHFSAVGIANQKWTIYQAALAYYNQLLGHTIAPTIIPAPVPPMGNLSTKKRKKKLARR